MRAAVAGVAMRATVAGTAAQTRNKTGGGGGHDAQGGVGTVATVTVAGAVTAWGRWRGRSVFGGRRALLCDWRRGAPARFIRAIITQFADCNRQLRPANPAAVPGSRGEFKRRCGSYEKTLDARSTTCGRDRGGGCRRSGK